MKINIDLSNVLDDINPHFHKSLKVKDRYLVEYGGAGSGKSHSIAQKILIRIFVGFDTGIVHKFLCLRKTQPACRRSIFAFLNHSVENSIRSS